MSTRGWVLVGVAGAALLVSGCAVSVHGSASASASSSSRASTTSGSSSGAGASTASTSGRPASTSSTVTTQTAQREPAPAREPAPRPRPPRQTVFGSTGRIDYALTGNVYYLPENTQVLPDFSTLEPVGTVFTRSIDIAPRRFEEGFPGISERYEWFGVRYEGTLFIANEGEYGFRINSDDGARLYIDGQLVVDNDRQHAPRSREGRVTLTPGRHRMVVEYFQGPRYQIALQLYWTPPGGQEAIFVMPTEEGAQQQETAFGSTRRMDDAFTGNVFFIPEDTQRLPDLSGLEPVGQVYTRTIDIPARRFDEGFPGISERYEWFAVRYQGSGFFPRGGDYTFRVVSDDGARLYVDGRLVVDNDNLHAPRERSGTVHLSAGEHEVVVEYFQGPRFQIALQVFWTPPGGQESIFELPRAPGRRRGQDQGQGRGRGRGHGRGGR